MLVAVRAWMLVGVLVWMLQPVVDLESEWLLLPVPRRWPAGRHRRQARVQ